MSGVKFWLGRSFPKPADSAMPKTTQTVLLIAKQIFEAEKPEDRAWNRTFDDQAMREAPKKPLSETERESFYRRARKMLGMQRAGA